MALLKTAFVGVIGLVWAGVGAALAEESNASESAAKPRVVHPAVTDGTISVTCETQTTLTKTSELNSTLSKHHYDLDVFYKDGKVADVVQQNSQDYSPVGDAITACSTGLILKKAAASPAFCAVSNFRDGGYFLDRTHAKAQGAQVENTQLRIYGFLSVDAKEMYFIWYDSDENGPRGKFTKGIEIGSCTFK